MSRPLRGPISKKSAGRKSAKTTAMRAKATPPAKVSDDIADLFNLDKQRGHKWRRLRADSRQKDAARYVMALECMGWQTMSAVRAAMRAENFGLSRSTILAALKRHRPAIERSATYQVRRDEA